MPPKSEFAEFRVTIFDCKRIKSQMPDVARAKTTSGTVVFPYPIYCQRGTAKYAVNAPVGGSIARPVISPLLFISLAFVSTAGKPGPLRSLRSVGVLP